jgi:hypothetical protein
LPGWGNPSGAPQFAETRSRHQWRHAEARRHFIRRRVPVLQKFSDDAIAQPMHRATYAARGFSGRASTFEAGGFRIGGGPRDLGKKGKLAGVSGGGH